jgi:hypothetical protein
MSYYVHSVPGRVRVKIPALKNMPHRCRDVQRIFVGLEAVERISVNPATGSVVIHYNPDLIDSQHILHALVEKGYFHGRTDGQSHGGPVRVSNKTGRAVSKALFGWAVGKALEPTGLSFLASFI